MLNVRIRNKRDTNNNFEKNDPVLLNGEIVIVDHETDGTKIKIGDGVNKYSSLPYFNPLYSEKPVYTYSEIQGLDEVISNLEAKIQLIPIIVCKRLIGICLISVICSWIMTMLVIMQQKKHKICFLK